MTDLADLIKEHDWDELIFGGYLCLTCTPDGDMDATGWPCPPLRAAGMTDAHAVAVIENRRLRVELRDKGNDLLAVRGILSPNGQPRRVPEPLGETVAPAVQWLVDEVERLRAAGEKYCDVGYPLGGMQPRVNWCGLGRGHAGMHVGGAVGVSFTDVGTVRRGGVS